MRMIGRGWICWGVVVVGMGLWPGVGEDVRGGEEGRLAAFFDRYLDETFRLRPLEATRLGDHRFDGELEDLTPAGRAAWDRQVRRTLAALPRAVHFAALGRDGQVDYEILRHELERSLWLSARTRPFAEDPRVYSEYINDSVYLLLTQSTCAAETNVANVLRRMAAIPGVVAAAKANLANPPAALVDTAIRQNRGAIGFYRRDLFDLVGDTTRRAELETGAARVVASLEDYQQWLEKTLAPRANGDWRLGRARFAKKLELELDAGVGADRVLAYAEAEFARVEAEMYVVARQLWSRYCPGVALPPDDEPGRRAAISEVLTRVGREHSRPEDLVRDVRGVVDRVRTFLKDGRVLPLPEPDRCRIIEMPEFQRGNSTAYMNSPPPLDPEAAGYYAVSPPPSDWDSGRVESYLAEYNAQMLQILTIHEAYPGHYVQLEYANRQPSKIRRVLSSGVYIEGWAVYTEQTMLDQGYGDGSLPLRLTQLKFYLRAVANAILDHRLHCGEWSDERALQFLIAEAFQSEGEARLKLIRAKQSSVQLSTYFVGRMAMYRLRQQVEREQGAAFDLARYHEAVLAPGAVPVKYLPELVRRRLAEVR